MNELKQPKSYTEYLKLSKDEKIKVLKDNDNISMLEKAREYLSISIRNA